MSLVVFCVLLSTVACETASPIVLRDCSKEVRGQASIYVILAGGSMQSSLHLHKRPLLVRYQLLVLELFQVWEDIRIWNKIL